MTQAQATPALDRPSGPDGRSVPHRAGMLRAGFPTERLPRFVLVWGPSVLPALVMLVVGRWRMNRPAIGWDESITWSVSQRTLPQIVEQARHIDGVIAPYYAFIHFWTAAFGDSVLSMRMPSLIAAAVAVGLTGELGRRLFSPGVGALGALLLALVPQTSRYAQDARSYGLALMFGVLSTLLLYLAFQRPTWGRWVGYAVALTLLGLTHMLSLLVLAGHVVAVTVRWWVDRDRRLLRWWPTVAAAVVPVLPVIYLGLTQRNDQLAWIEPMDRDTVIDAPGDLFRSAAVGLLIIGLALGARWADRRLPREFAATIVIPPAVLISVSFVTSPIWVPRYVLYVVPLLCLLAAVTLRGLRLRAIVAVALVAVVSIPSHKDLRRRDSHDGPDFRQVANLIARHQRPGDGIVYGPSGGWALRAAMDYSFRDRPRPRDVLLARPAAEVGQLSAVQCADQVACLAGTRRVWLFTSKDNVDPLTDAGAVTEHLKTRYRPVQVFDLWYSTLALYELR